MASPEGDGNEKTPRMPKDLKGLLQFCMENTKSEDPTSSSHFEQMPEEKKQWLENALKEMSVNPVERMMECISVVKTERDSDDGIEKKIAALEEIIEWTEQIDFAIDFHKVGGFEILPQLFHSDVADLRWTCLELVATLVQNNPYCQAAIIQGGFFPTLLQLLDKDPNSTVQTKALYAVSCLCRENPEAQKLFVDSDGFSVLMRAMQSDTDKLKIKSSFFLSNLCTSQPVYKDILCDIGMIDQLIGHLSEEHTQLHEHLMSALLSIATGHSRAIAECQKPELNLHSLLKERIEMLKNKEEFKEESEYAQQLLQIISSSDGVTQDSEDR